MLLIKKHSIKIINYNVKMVYHKNNFLYSYHRTYSLVKFYSKKPVADYINVSFATKYESKVVEKNKYEKWESSGLFSPKFNSDCLHHKPFTMVMPPPNITGTLHLGHALTIAIQDVLCRWKRMLGNSVLWVPGTDHAGIATQVVVEKNLVKQKGLRMQDLKSEDILEELLNWQKEKEDRIKQQIKQLGASVDWSRYTFTMDNKRSEIVRDAIITLFDEGLIEKKTSLVNWCPFLQSTIADIEINKVPINGSTFVSLPGYDDPIEFGTMLTFAYKVCDSDEELIVATTRPETLCGDVAVVVNPNDSRFNHLKDKFVWHPFRKCRLPIIFDEAAILEFGTGAFKVTPAHDKLDFNIAQKYNLPKISVIAEDGTLNENCGEWANILRFRARPLIQQRLKELGLFKGIKEHNTTIPLCSRTGDVVEQMLKPQWFLKCSELEQKILDILKTDGIEIRPEGMKRYMENWLKSNQDWCLSRQIKWGHKLPFYETKYGWVAARSKEEAREKAKNKFLQPCNELEQESDVLDTWFSSALLPISVFGWPDPTNEDYAKYYPLSLMETGRDISCLWVARMMMLGLQFTKKLPFNKIILHGMICDNEGRKMSKSLGNVIELNHVIDGISLKELNETVYSNHKRGILSDKELKNALSIQKSLFPNGIPACGADALRFTLLSQDILDPVINFNIQECQRATHFCNKMWQAFRFSVTWANKFMVKTGIPPIPILPWHDWLLDRLACTVKNTNYGLTEMDFSYSTKELKNFFINDLCDFYLEVSKPVFHGGDENLAKATCSILIFSLETFTRLIAPIMPFVSEELYSYLPGNTEQITNVEYPRIEEYEKWYNQDINNEILFLRDVISCIRGLQTAIKSFSNNEIVIITKKKNILEKYQPLIEVLLKSSVEFRNDPFDLPALANSIENHTKIYLKLKTKDHENVSKFLLQIDSKIDRLTNMLSKIEIKVEKNVENFSEEKKIIHREKMKKLQEELNELEAIRKQLRKN